MIRRTFLDSHSNVENERLLKTTASKIKASKKNISVKFMSDIEYQQVFKDFLNSLANDNPKSIVKQKENGDLKFTIENNVLKDILESKLKKWVNTTFTYTLTQRTAQYIVHSFFDYDKRISKSTG